MSAIDSSGFLLRLCRLYRLRPAAAAGGGLQAEPITATNADATVGEAEAHLWLVDADAVGEGDEHALARCLTDDEHERAGRFRFERDRARFVVRRALLRHVLGAYMGCAPDTVAFVNGAHGKPALAPGDRDAIAFNAAHSRGLAGVAVTRGRAVGLDVERCERAAGVDWAPIVERLGHARERAALERGDGAVDAARCLRWWTVKEAVLKARGDGLMMDASRVDISLLLRVESGVVEDEMTAWQCAVVDVMADAQIALAVERGRANDSL